MSILAGIKSCDMKKTMSNPRPLPFWGKKQYSIKLACGSNKDMHAADCV